MIMPRKCFYCDGAGRFLVREEQNWPDDGREAPEPNEPIIVRCPACDGAGEKRDRA